MNGQHARWKGRADGDMRDIAPSSIKYIERMFQSSNRMESELIEARYPVQIGHASDPCQPFERWFRLLFKTLKILNDREYPTIITTKWPTLLTEDPYIRLVSGMAIQCSISSEDQVTLARLEPNAPSMRRRFAALQTLADAGAYPILRLWPYIPDIAGNLYEMLAMAKDSGINTVQCNFLKIFNADQKAMLPYLKNTCLPYEQRGNFKICSPWYQEEEVRRISDTCRELGLEMVTCDDWTGERAWRDCCGVGSLPGFKPVPWAYYVNGHRITEHTSFDEYMKGHDCPWHDEFEMEWNRGRLAKAILGLTFHEEDITYSRSLM